MTLPLTEMEKDLEGADLGGKYQRFAFEHISLRCPQISKRVKSAVGVQNYGRGQDRMELEIQMYESFVHRQYFKLWDLMSPPRQEELRESRGDQKLNQQAVEKMQKRAKKTEKGMIKGQIKMSQAGNSAHYVKCIS